MSESRGVEESSAEGLLCPEQRKDPVGRGELSLPRITAEAPLVCLQSFGGLLGRGWLPQRLCLP